RGGSSPARPIPAAARARARPPPAGGAPPARPRAKAPPRTADRRAPTASSLAEGRLLGPALAVEDEIASRVLHEQLDLAFCLLQLGMAEPREADPLLVEGERLLEGQLALLEALDDRLQLLERGLEAGRLLVAHASSFEVTTAPRPRPRTRSRARSSRRRRPVSARRCSSSTLWAWLRTRPRSASKTRWEARRPTRERTRASVRLSAACWRRARASMRAQISSLAWITCSAAAEGVEIGRAHV